VELKSLLRQAVEDLDVSQAPNISCLRHGVREKMGWKIPTTKVGHKYTMDPGEKTFIFVCFLHFCVDDLLLLIQHAASCVSEKLKG